MFADIELAKSPEDVTRFLEENQDNTAGLLFFDSTAKEGGDTGFWGGVITSITNAFSDSDEGGNGSHVATVEEDISTEAELMRIDVSHQDFREIQESYDVVAVPFLILFKKGIPVLREVPSAETHDKILEVLDVAPTIVEPTAAPGPVAAPAAPQTRRVVQDNTPKLNPNKKCTDVTSYEADSASHWRDTPYYIKELEDYEIPEDWWRHGYKALNNTSERQRKIQWSEQEYITPETPGFIGPLLPVRPHEAIVVAPEPRIRVTPESRVRVAPEPVVRVTPEPRVRVAPEPRVRVAPEPSVRTASPIGISEERLVNIREVSGPGPISGRQVVPGLVAGQIINPDIAPRHYHGAIHAINNATLAGPTMATLASSKTAPATPKAAVSGSRSAPIKPTTPANKPSSNVSPNPKTASTKPASVTSSPRSAPIASSGGRNTSRTPLPSNAPTKSTTPANNSRAAGPTRPISGPSNSNIPSRPTSGPTGTPSGPNRTSPSTQSPTPPSSR